MSEPAVPEGHSGHLAKDVIPGVCCCLQDSTPRPRLSLQQIPSCPARPQNPEGRRREALAQPAPPETSQGTKRQPRSDKLAGRPLSRIKILSRTGCCAGFGWHRLNFLHSSWYGAMFWICAGNSVDNAGMFLLLLSSAYTESRPGRGHSRDS